MVVEVSLDCNKEQWAVGWQAARTPEEGGRYESLSEHHTARDTGVWHLAVGCTGLITTQYSPDDWKLGTVEVDIGFSSLVNLTCTSKMLKYCMAGIWEKGKLNMNKITGKAVRRQPAGRGGFHLLSMCQCASEKEMLKLLIRDLLSAPRGWVPGSFAAFLKAFKPCALCKRTGVIFAHVFALKKKCWNEVC